MINLTMSRREYFVPLLIWPCLNIITYNLEMLVAPLSQMLDLMINLTISQMLDLSGSVRDLLSGQLAGAIRHRQGLKLAQRIP